MDLHLQQECLISTDPRRHNTSGRAIEPKCKLMLVKSPDSIHKKIIADHTCIFCVIV